MTHFSLFWLPTLDVRTHVRAARHGLFGGLRFRVTGLGRCGNAARLSTRCLFSTVFLFFNNRLPLRDLAWQASGPSAIEEWSNLRDPGGLAA